MLFVQPVVASERLWVNIMTDVQICGFPAEVGLFLGLMSLFPFLVSVTPTPKLHLALVQKQPVVAQPVSCCQDFRHIFQNFQQL